MNTWYQTKVKYTKQLENGTFKRVSEPYLVASVTHGDAEARIYEELGSIIRGEFSVVGVVPFPVVDIFHFEESDIWWVCQVSMQDPSLDSDKIKMIKAKYLVSADDIKDAYEKLNESLYGMVMDYSITSVQVSQIVDIFPYKEELDKEISRSNEVYVLASDGSPAVIGKTYSEGELILKSEYERKIQSNFDEETENVEEEVESENEYDNV